MAEPTDSAPGWRNALVVHLRDVADSRDIAVAVGLITTSGGGTQLAMRVDGGDPMVLSLQAANQLIANVADVQTARLQLTQEALGNNANGQVTDITQKDER